MTHLALRLGSTPLCVFDSVDASVSRTVSTAVVGGARASFYVRDVSQAVSTVGAMLEPGAASLLLGVPAEELAGHHTPLDALWGSTVESMRAQLAEAPSLPARLTLFERLLSARLPRLRGLHPAVAEGLMRLAHEADVAAAVAASGYSHRRFTTLFRAAVGLPPKLFCRVQRFTRALREAEAGSTHARPHSWSALALAAGYSDQAHFNRDFREFTGLTPGRYRALAPTFAHHVPLPQAGD
jgi:AraC-like DNA-binding protein